MNSRVFTNVFSNGIPPILEEYGGRHDVRVDEGFAPTVVAA